MIETRIPIAPDTSTTLTDETTEHIVNRKVTIKIDIHVILKKKVCRTIRATGKTKAATLLQEEIISTQKSRSWAHLYSLAAILYKFPR